MIALLPIDIANITGRLRHALPVAQLLELILGAHQPGVRLVIRFFVPQQMPQGALTLRLKMRFRG